MVIVVVSKDKDFSAVIAEQVKHALSPVCYVVENSQDARDFAPALIIADEAVETDAPMLTPKTKPFRLPELLAEAAALLQKDALTLNRGYTLHVQQKQLANEVSKTIGLTDKETQLLQCLAVAKGDSISKEQLLKTVWGFDSPLNTHTLETHIYRLRGKLRELGEEEMIAAVEGGYRLI